MTTILSGWQKMEENIAMFVMTGYTMGKDGKTIKIHEDEGE